MRKIRRDRLRYKVEIVTGGVKQSQEILLISPGASRKHIFGSGRQKKWLD